MTSTRLMRMDIYPQRAARTRTTHTQTSAHQGEVDLHARHVQTSTASSGCATHCMTCLQHAATPPVHAHVRGSLPTSCAHLIQQPITCQIAQMSVHTRHAGLQTHRGRSIRKENTCKLCARITFMTVLLGWSVFLSLRGSTHTSAAEVMSS